MILTLLASVAAIPETPLTRDELAEEAAKLVQSLADEDAFSGTVLIAQGEDVIFSTAVGEASKRFHVPNDIDTKFNLGSMNKMFTSVCIAQLVEADKVSYDDPISKYVDETWLPREITDRVTVRHLATHTSGLGSYFNETYDKSSRALFRAVDDYKPLVRGETLAFEPGEHWAYSNTGMLLLGVVIEKASGQDYFEYVREHVYAPAEMKSTDCYEMDRPVENLAIGYDKDEDGTWRNNLYMHVIKGGPAGGGFSTVGDLHRFALALLDGRLVSVSSLDRMWTDHAGAGYGYGFTVHEAPGCKVVGHSGGFPGISANLDILIDRGFIIAVLSNYSGAAHRVSMPLRELALRAN